MTALAMTELPGATSGVTGDDQDQGEVWRPVVGFEGLYEVSSLGCVRRVAPAAGSQSRPGRHLRPGRDRTGRPMVNLYRAGKLAPRQVAHLVANAFCGPRPAGHVVTTRNGDPSDVSAANLVYRTRRQVNVRATAPLRKLSASQAAEIRAARGRCSVRALARRYGIAAATVSRIQRGEAYPNLDDFEAGAGVGVAVATSKRQECQECQERQERAGAAVLLAGAPRRPCRPGIAHIADLADGDPRHPVAGCARVPLDATTLTPADGVAAQARCRRHGCRKRWPAAPQAAEHAAEHAAVRGDAA